MNHLLNWTLEQTAKDLQVDFKVVASVYKSYWRFIKEKIAEKEFLQMTEEDFSLVPTNFNIPFIGKLYTDYDKIQKYNRKLKYYQHVKHKGNKTNRKSGIS